MSQAPEGSTPEQARPEQPKPGLEVDDQWKREAQREKERLAGERAAAGRDAAQAGRAGAAANRGTSGAASPDPAQTAEPSPEPSPEPAGSGTGNKGGGRALPPASFEFLVEQFVTQALLYMGLIAHPATGKPQRDLDMAKHAIDMLGVIEAKTKGNLAPEEQRILASALYEVRMNYVRVARGR